ncbi:hypothetical protein EAI_02470 [Harpegnathos saltator]|uniref:Serine/arginine repetitive matrix protein 2 n=1 Tax=Harpegnathos saltator TaxID=610380 RepID=E2B7G2_HARSA|nr:hypothetical protein EAI_02470 [Harpegnathos saltator]
MTMSTTMPAAKPARGRGPADGRAFFETLWRGNFLLDRQKMLKRSRKRKLHAAANGKRQQRAQQQQQQQQLQMRQHCCCCQRIQLHLLAGRRSNMRSVVSVRETHQIAEAQQEKNAKLREAFGISEFFVEGSSLDPERHAREAEARAAAAASKVYELVRTPSPVAVPSSDAAAGAVPAAAAASAVASVEKKKRKRSGSASAKKKKTKKHKRERSETPKSAKKKEKSKKKKKERKHRKTEATSSDSDSSEDSDDSNSSEAESKKKKKRKKKKLKAEGKDKHEKKKTSTKRKRQSSESSTDRQSRNNETPPIKMKKDSPVKKSATETRRTDKSPPVSHKSPPRRHRSSSRGRGDRGGAGGGGRSPRRYSRSRRISPSPRRRRYSSRSPGNGRRRGRHSAAASRSRSRSRYDRYVSSRRRLSPSSSSRRRRSQSRGRSRSPARRGQRRARSRSTLSYSPVRKNPERYKDILEEQKRRDRKTRKRTSGRAKSRSTSRNRRGAQVVAPRVSLRSSSEDEADLADDESKQQQQEDEERMMELNTLKRLQSGLAAKARETLEKKSVIAPAKIKIERREDNSNVLDIALPNEPPKSSMVAASSSLMSTPSARDRSQSRDHQVTSIMPSLQTVRSPVSSRSPSPALPLTREEAAIKIRSPSESPPPPILPTSLPNQQSFDKVTVSPVAMKINRRSSRSPPNISSKKDSPTASRKDPSMKAGEQSSSCSPTMTIAAQIGIEVMHKVTVTVIRQEVFQITVAAGQEIAVPLARQEIGIADETTIVQIGVTDEEVVAEDANETLVPIEIFLGIETLHGVAVTFYHVR